MVAEWTDEQREAIGRGEFLIVEEGFLDDDAVEALRERFDPLFAGLRDGNTRDGRRTAWLDELIAVDRGHPMGPTPR